MGEPQNPLSVFRAPEAMEEDKMHLHNPRNVVTKLLLNPLCCLREMKMVSQSTDPDHALFKETAFSARTHVSLDEGTG